jgi:tRNA G46 methylase TrmB
MVFFLEIIFFVFVALVVARFLFIRHFTKKAVEDYLRGESPFIPAKPGDLKQIAKALKIERDSIVYDLGAGDARVLISCSEIQPGAKYVGIEKNFLPYFWAKTRLLLLGRSEKIKILKKDIFGTDISDATHVFIYLIPKQIEKLLPKFEKELKPGTRVLSLKFELPTKVQKEIIKLGKENLFIYEY